MTRIVVAAVAWFSVAAAASAQTLPSEPVSFGNGRVVLGGDVAATIAPVDRGSSVRPGGRPQHDAGVPHRTERAGARHPPRLTAGGSAIREPRRLCRPSRCTRGCGRLRTAGSTSRSVASRRRSASSPAWPTRSRTRSSAIRSPISTLTSLRPDALPASTDELLQMRARGWRSSFSVGESTPAPGVPLAASLTWDTGVQVIAGLKAVTLVGAVTNGTLSNPRVSDDNGGKTVAACM